MIIISFIKSHPVLTIIVLGIALGSLLVLSGRENNKSDDNDEGKIKAIVESLEGVDEVSVIVSRNHRNSISVFSDGTEIDSPISGIAITAKGADSPKIKQKIIELLSAAYSLPTNCIFVCGK